MNTRKEQFETLASLVQYPTGDYRQRCRAAIEVVPESQWLATHSDRAQALGLSELQELWTSTFDLKPVASLDLGWHLFGENYDRGLMLVRMREELTRHEIEESSELPDHLTHALRLLGCMSPEAAEDFAGACVMPALASIVRALPAQNPFHPLLLACRELIIHHFPETADRGAATPVFNIIREGALV